MRAAGEIEAVRPIKQRGVSYAQASKDLGVHPTQLRNWVKQLADDPQHAFPGHGQMKPEQQEIERLKRNRSRLALLPVTEPMEHAVSGAICWQRVPNVDCIGSNV